MEQYLLEHLEGRYLPNGGEDAGVCSYPSVFGWRDEYLGKHMVFSHRTNTYTPANFPEKLHSHDYYELDIYHSGPVTYTAGDRELIPQRGDILLFRPGCAHTARLRAPGVYRRTVFYFTEAFFTGLGIGELPGFLTDGPALCSIPPERQREFGQLLEELSREAVQTSEGALLRCSRILHLFYLIQSLARSNPSGIAQVPKTVREIRSFVDGNYTRLHTVTEIAQHFFYSREYVSRIFKQYYNLPLSEYLTEQKLDHARKLLLAGKPVSFACDGAGFGSMSSFIQAFRRRYGRNPSACKPRTGSQ